MAGAILGGIVNSLTMSTPEELEKMTDAKRSEASFHQLGQLITVVGGYYLFFVWLAFVLWSFRLLLDVATLLYRRKRGTLSKPNELTLLLISQCRLIKGLQLHRLRLLIPVTLATNYSLAIATGYPISKLFAS
jgi:hypothetical protein